MMRTTLSLFAGSLLIFLGALAAYGVWYDVVGKMSARLAELTTLIQARSDESHQILMAKKTLAALASEGILFDTYFVAEVDIVPFLERIENLGTSLGAVVEVSSVAPESKSADARLVVGLSISGSFDSVFRTLGAIEHAPYDLVTKNLSLRGQTSSEGVSSWVANATFSIGSKEASPQENISPKADI